MSKCPECGASTYKADFGCWTCGYGNPFRGLSNVLKRYGLAGTPEGT